MKYLLILAVICAVWWFIRRNARPSLHKQAPKDGAPAPQPIVACQFCGVHLPSGEALPGRGGVFCEPAHRAAYEAAHPLP